MALRIGTNIPAITAQRLMQKAEDRAAHAMRALASGSRIVSAGDDAAGFAISEVLRGQAKSLEQAKQNSEGAIALVQVAEGSLNEQNNILIRLRELAVQSSSDTVSDEEREFINVEFRQLVEEFDRIAKTTQYGAKKLLMGGSEELEFHLGPRNEVEDVIKYTWDADTTAATFEIEEMSVEEQDEAREVIDDIDSSLSKIAGVRANFGALQSRLTIAGSNLDQQHENVVAARSRITDADVAYEVTEMALGNIQKELSVAVLAQANQDPQVALKLL